jgi:hypothetical protein
MHRSLVPLLAFALASSACAASHEFTQSGKLKVDANAERSATLHAACSPEPSGGALSIELVVPEANTRKDFDYDDFEGPDAAAGNKALSTLTWNTAAGATTIAHAAAGWYASEPPQSFMFGISQPSHHRAEPARLLNAIRTDAGQLTWTQTGFDDAKRQLVARFELDAAAAERLHIALAECLPQSMPTNK